LAIGLPLAVFLAQALHSNSNAGPARLQFRRRHRGIARVRRAADRPRHLSGSFIAEIVRAGILAVSWGQSEAAMALGLRPGSACG